MPCDITASCKATLTGFHIVLNFIFMSVFLMPVENGKFLLKALVSLSSVISAD